MTQFLLIGWLFGWPIALLAVVLGVAIAVVVAVRTNRNVNDEPSARERVIDPEEAVS